MEGERLKTLPQGYGPDNPAIEYLKHKSFIMTTALADELWTQPDAVKKIASLCGVANEWVGFLNRAMDA
jgi:uncharacterized protein (DUF2461 family)